MTISFQTQGGHTYGTLCTVTRVGQKVVKTYGESLGRVVDKERLVFYSRSRGLFQYDLETGGYLPAPPDVEMPKRKSRLKVPAPLVSFVFGDVYLLDRFMDKLGLYPVLKSAYKDRLDALKAMACFYLVSTLSNCYAGQWLERSIAHRLFPQAHLSSSQVSDLLKYLGDPSRQQVFFLNYLQWFVDNHATDKLGHILIDSTGLPNSIHFSLTAISNHNGDINNEVRLIYVVQQTTGLPIYMRCVPGNIIDINTLKRTILELKQMGVDTNFAITDAGYLSEENVNTFYEEQVSFLARLQPNRRLFKSIVKEHLADTKENGVLVKQNNRLVRIKKVSCQLNEKIGKNEKVIEPGHSAYAYLCIDLQRSALEQLSLIEKVAEGSLSTESYESKIEKAGIFMLVSKRSIAPSKVLEIYYTRQEIEQVFDLGKNYASMLPLSVQTEETFRGHMVLTFIATIVAKLLSDRLKETKYPIQPTLANLATQSCSEIKGSLITSEPNKVTRLAYKAAGVEYPVCIE